MHAEHASLIRRCMQVLKWHKSQQSQKSKEEIARISALRRQDYSAYLQLAQEAKAEKVRDAIDATERVMLALTEKVCQSLFTTCMLRGRCLVGRHLM